MSNLQEIKDLVSISAVADYLGLVEEYGKRKFPGERTASIQLYKDNRFHDFGRNVDGDIFDLMIHVRGYTLKEAMAELKSAFNIKDSPIGKNTVKEAWIAYLERKFNAKYIEHYDYFLTDQSGKAVYAYTKVRLQDKAGKKKLIYGRFNGDRFILGLQGKKAKDILAIYGSSVFAIQKAIDRQETIFYVEGEKDANTLMEKGYTVFTCGGSGDWKKGVSEIVRQANVIILVDNDKSGEQLAYQVMSNLISSDWIRPEDLCYYEKLCEETDNFNLSIKLVERTKSTKFLTRVVEAYARRQYKGNLLDILLWPKSDDMVVKTEPTAEEIKTMAELYNISQMFNYSKIFDLPNIYIDNTKLDGFLKKFVDDYACNHKICVSKQNIDVTDSNYCSYCSSWVQRAIIYNGEQVEKWIDNCREFEKALDRSEVFRSVL